MKKDIFHFTSKIFQQNYNQTNTLNYLNSKFSLKFSVKIIII